MVVKINLEKRGLSYSPILSFLVRQIYRNLILWQREFAEIFIAQNVLQSIILRHKNTYLFGA